MVNLLLIKTKQKKPSWQWTLRVLGLQITFRQEISPLTLNYMCVASHLFCSRAFILFSLWKASPRCSRMSYCHRQDPLSWQTAATPQRDGIKELRFNGLLADFMADVHSNNNFWIISTIIRLCNSSEVLAGVCVVAGECQAFLFSKRSGSDGLSMDRGPRPSFA